MEDFQSKYSGEQVEEMLDQIANGEAGGGSGGITVETDPIFSASPSASITEEKKTEWDNKQDAISDLEAIRSGAALGATALQSVPSGYATTSDLDGKVDKISGKALSTEDFTTALKTKLEGLSNYDDEEIQNALSTLRGDFDALVSGDTTTAIKTFNEVIAFLDGVQDTQDLASIIASIEQQIAGKMDKVTLATVATSGSYNDLSDKPTIPSEQVNADWNATSGKAQILNKPTIPSAVTESTVSGWGFTKNTGTYSKPSGGIPKTDLASVVQTSLGKADTALQAHQDISGKQDKLVSGTNIKTINGESILGTGDITIKERELEKYATDKSWSIVAFNLLELLIEYGNAPDGTKAIVVADANSLYGVNLFDALMGNVDGMVDVFTNLNAFTLEISAIDTSVELPVSITSDVSVEVPFNDTIYIDMGADMASIYHIYVQAGFTESVWGEGYWHGTSYMIGNKMPLSKLMTFDDNTIAGLMAIAPALIVDFVGTKTITEYVKNGDNWEVWSEGESGLNTKLNAWLEQIAQLLPTKTSQLENDSNFVSSDGLKTINGQSLIGSGDIEISGGEGGGSASDGRKEVIYVDQESTITSMRPNVIYWIVGFGDISIESFEESVYGVDTYDVFTAIIELEQYNDTVSLTLPDYVQWANGVIPGIVAGEQELSISRISDGDYTKYYAVLTPFKPV